MSSIKRNSKTNQPITHDSLQQVIYKDSWKSANNGGKIREWVILEKGIDMLRLAEPEEVVPNENKFYLVDPINKNIFYLSTFHNEVEWSTIEDFLTAKRICPRKVFHLGDGIIMMN